MEKYSQLLAGIVGSIALSSGAAQAQIAPPATSVILPQDEAPHHNLGEWWYFVGHLTGVDPAGQQHQYGYEVTVFQTNVGTLLPANYTIHYALTDIIRQQYHYEERATEAPIPNQVDGFSLGVTNWTASGGSGAYALNTSFADGSYALNLNLKATVPPTLHGDKGIIPYGPLGTSAYYSYTSLATSGTIIDHGVPVTITGVSWQDRQWQNVLPSGWNWFSIQLNNNVQYMLYFIQDPLGNIIQKTGTEIVNGVATPIAADQMSVKPLAFWTSPNSLYTYPSQWQVTVPDGTYTVTPVVPGQELVWPLHRTYFEGDSQITGTRNGQAISGAGYTEVNPFFEPIASLP